METSQTLNFVRKPTSLDVVRAEQGERMRVLVIETRAVSANEYEEIASNLFASRPWLAGKGGIEYGAARCVAVQAPERPTMYINPEGSDYARYVAIGA
ncbi:hypothetical protein RQP53_03470 [Paucibacter sp. APW11]|uniref:Uncharacterized protein n=1 Tax=Roseateles aquae TaxID=3077235 RepID=A0ABU3P7N9_9BURK|nr:hypothetical protein [Paucibacter sp. APW11]MDT8998332.1 hypothetical protein [Paucibacter sp. APW11]